MKHDKEVSICLNFQIFFTSDLHRAEGDTFSKTEFKLS